MVLWKLGRVKVCGAVKLRESSNVGDAVELRKSYVGDAVKLRKSCVGVAVIRKKQLCFLSADNLVPNVLKMLL